MQQESQGYNLIDQSIASEPKPDAFWNGRHTIPLQRVFIHSYFSYLKIPKAIWYKIQFQIIFHI